MKKEFNSYSTRESDKPDNNVIDKYGELFKTINSELAYLHATNLALKGKLKEAEEVISPVYVESSSLKVFDLFAKILAQQKKYEEARDIWQRVSELEPGNKYIRKSINRCNSLIKKET